MALEIGSIVEGKITGLTKYGAFVQLPDNGVGMVHISEVSYQYVNDISEHLQAGQTVKVKVISIDENGRIALSIKKALPPRPSNRPVHSQEANTERVQTNPNPQFKNRNNNIPQKTEVPADQAFEDKLKQFMQTSEGKMSDLKHYNDRKVGSRRGRK